MWTKHVKCLEDVRDGCEHKLVNAEKNGGDTGGADRGLVKDTLEAKVLEVADELGACFTEGE